MNLTEVSALLLGLDGVRVELHETKPATFNRWLVGDKAIAWHRPLSKKDTDALRSAAATGGRPVSQGILAGEVLAMHVADLGEKQAWLEAAPDTCFDAPHFAKYPAVLIDLQNADPQVVLEIADACAERYRN